MTKVFFQLCIIDLMRINIHQLIYRMEIFKKHMEIINEKNYNFLNPINFDKNFLKVKTEKNINYYR